MNLEPLQADLLASSFLHEFEVVLEYGVYPALIPPNDDDPCRMAGSFNRRDIAVFILSRHFALTIHSIWEANLRHWLRTCAREVGLGTDMDARLKRAGIGDLLLALRSIRGVALSELPGGQALAELSSISNVIRHGDGPACERLREEKPHLWFREWNGEGDPSSDLGLTERDLQRYADAVFAFWLAVASTLPPVPEPPWLRR